MFGCVRIPTVTALNITIHAALGICIHIKEDATEIRSSRTSAIDSHLCLILVNRVLGTEVDGEHERLRV
jgi:hypothetical protein